VFRCKFDGMDFDSMDFAAIVSPQSDAERKGKAHRRTRGRTIAPPREDD